MKKLVLILTLMTGALVANMPPPYSYIEVLPEDRHGWYKNERQLRAIIAGNSQIKEIVEVGSWLGRSTISLAEMLPEDGVLYAIDHWKGSVENQKGQRAYHEAMPVLYQQFLSNVIHAGMAHKIVPVRMDSLEAAKSLLVQPDLIYLDGSHDTRSVLKDLKAWYPRLAKGGIMCGDDWEWGKGEVRKAVEIFARRNDLHIEHEGNFWRFRP